MKTLVPPNAGAQFYPCESPETRPRSKSEFGSVYKLIDSLITSQFRPHSATGTKPKVLQGGVASASASRDLGVAKTSCHLSETQRALVTEIMESWNKKKSPIVMKKVDFAQTFSQFEFKSIFLLGPNVQQEWERDTPEAPEEEPTAGQPSSSSVGRDLCA